MEAPKIPSTDSTNDIIASSFQKLKGSVLSLVLGIPGFCISCCLLLFYYFISMAGGGLDIMTSRTQQQVFIATLYCSLLTGIIGGILGVVGIKRRENKVANSISITLGALMLCICSVLTFFIFMLYG